jgi:DNA-binding PadR family transcriptional regulator
MEEKTCCGAPIPECCDMKGFLSFLILWMLYKENMKGSEITKELERRRGFKPSPGTVYPALKELREKELIDFDEKKTYHLTAKGKKETVQSCKYFFSIFYDITDMLQCCNSYD